MFFNIVKADYIEDYKLSLLFKDGKTGIIDLSDYISVGEIYKDIRTFGEFSRFKLEFGTIVWKDGDIDIAPETLYEKATSEKIVLTCEKTLRGA